MGLQSPQMIRSLSFVIPAYNDEKTIQTAIGEARDEAKRLNIPFEILVIDDKSPDNQAQVLHRLKKKIRELRVIYHTVNKGYGGTIKELYYTGKYQWLFTIPGDYQIGAKELRKLTPFVDRADMIVGRRIKRNDPKARQRQSKIYNFLLQLLFGMPVHDANSVRLMKRDVMKKVKLTSESAFVDAELVLRARDAGFRIVEVPIIHHGRAKGSGTGGGGSLKTILPTIQDMIRFFL